MKRTNTLIAFLTLASTFAMCTTSSAFRNDQSVLGEWKSVDFVHSISDFKPGKKSCRSDLYLKEFVFNKGGSTQNNAFTWTRGAVYYAEWSRNGKYEIRTFDKVEFLFLEWINGDVVKRKAKPCYYVFVKKDSNYKTNTPFIDDPEVVGTWRTIDFVNTIEHYDPSRSRKGNLFLKHLNFKEGGTLLCSNKKVKEYQEQWTNGKVNPNSQWPAHYYIKNIEEQSYLFYEWMSGDVTVRGEKPKYYVLKK